MKVVVDHARCVASGACVEASPKVFAQDDDGIVVILNEFPGEELREGVQEAIDSCPAAIIQAVEE